MSTPSQRPFPKVAVVGPGYWGRNLVRNFHQLGVLKRICDRNEAALQSMTQEYPDVEISLALADVLADSKIDALVVATPAETHAAIVREGLLAGKHVMVEKPLALSESEGRQLVKLAAEQNKVLMVGHLLQYHPGFLRLKEMVRTGDLGRINYIYSHRLNLGKIRREENILWSFAPHDISMILSLAGEPPEKIMATGGNYLHRQIADVTTTHMRFSSGMGAHIFVSWLHPFKEQKLVVVGEQKMAVFDDTLPWEEKLSVYPHEIKWEGPVPVPAKATPIHVKVEADEPLRCECQHFLECVRNGTTPRTDGIEGLQVLRVLNAAQRSLDAGGMEILNEQLDQMDPTDVFFHPTAVVDKNVQVGRGTRVWHFAHLLSGTRIGENCNIGQNVMIGPDVTIGKGCKVQNNVSLYKGVIFENAVFCGPSVVFTNIYNPRAEIRKMDQVRATRVAHGATLGANSTIVCGVNIGRYAFVGAGAVVTRNVADHSLVVGNPASHIGWMCKCGERLTDQLTCLTCRRRFVEHAGGLKEAAPAD